MEPLESQREIQKNRRAPRSFSTAPKTNIESNLYIFIKTLKTEREPLIIQFLKANFEFRFASKRLLASDFEALEVSWTPRGDQESFKEVSKSSKVTIHRACRVILSSPKPLPDIDPAATRLRWVCAPPFGEVIFPVGVLP